MIEQRKILNSLKEYYSVCEIAALLSGCDYEVVKAERDSYDFQTANPMYLECESIVIRAVENDQLIATKKVCRELMPWLDAEEKKELEKQGCRWTLDIHDTYLHCDKIREWCRLRGVSFDGFFHPQDLKVLSNSHKHLSEGAVGSGCNNDLAEYISYKDPKAFGYSNKLHAAVCAWEATVSKSSKSGKRIKTVVKEWLKEHYQEFSLINNNGKPNETAIEEIAKVVNWDTKGGASKTPKS